MCTHSRAGWGSRLAIAVAGMNWGGTATPGAGLAAAARRPRQKGSQQGRTPNGPPNTKPGPVARQPPASRHGPAPLRQIPASAALHRQAHAHEPRGPAPEAHGAPRPPQPGPRAGRSPPNPGGGWDPYRYTTERVKRMEGKVHLQRHHPLRAGRLRPGGQRPRSRVKSAAASAGDPGGRAGRSPGFQGPPL